MKTFIVDSFTNQAFKGNPAGVCLLDEAISEELMLSIAKELNFSETAFIQAGNGQNQWSIRYFSPVMEIPLCGHATLAAAKVLFSKINPDQIHFVTVEGLDLHIRREDNRIVMAFPIYELRPAQVPSATLEALGVDRVLDVGYNAETRILLLELENTGVLGDLKPDFQALKQSIDWVNGILVTAASCDDDFDFHSRYFWPWSGTNEDPVTGGTHTFLTKYWAKRLNRNKLNSWQASARTGSMALELLDDSLLIKGEAVIILEGTLNL